MPDIALSSRKSIGIVGWGPGGDHAVNVCTVWDGRNKTIWDLGPDSAREMARTLAQEASRLDGKPTGTAWVAYFQRDDRGMTDEAAVALFTTEALALAHVANLCRTAGDGLPDDDQEAVDAFFNARSGVWSVHEAPIQVTAPP